ncbi:CAZyme family AA3 [Agaricus bisporus var. burnettii]|uniref:pyranose dehydrogenase (acceptor) n=1 Tax=Agaricus bisporus var. burnettii TaxID=192524 RepID=A0A8H7C2F3_AGABI|nr:CAZyme family AA3 [Agaricus bisporus var. burnettii]
MATTSVFDYVIVGGGSAGLVVAARLTELQDISVCVLEAGGDITHTPEASVPGYGKALWFNKETDWGFLSVPQKHSEGAVLPMFRGKALGGSSMTGLMQLNRATAREYDALERIGNIGWNSAEIHKYMVKSQTLAYTPEELAENHFEADKKDFGSGPILNTPSPYKLTYRDEWYKALEECGVPYNANAIGGETMGSWMSPIAVHPKTRTRISSASAYYEPNKHRKNLTIITGAHVTRIQLNTTSGKPVAEGVYYETNGKKHVVSARKEVILSAGSIQTPQILELSGIGQKKILDKYGIPTVVELPGVGENYQVGFCINFVAMSYELKPGHESHHPLATSPEETISMITNICAFVPLPKLEDHQALLDLARKSNFSKIPPSVLNIQQEWFKDETMPQIELVTIPHFLPTAYQPEPDPEKRYLCVCGLLLHPFARGSIHINSSDAFKHPDIDLSAFDNEVDWQTFVQGAKLTRKVHLKTRAFNDVVAKEIAPGSDGDTQEGLEKYLKAQLVGGYHPVGTAAMMKKEEGGVVDNKLKVYGVDRLRVVDASILPFQLGTDPQTTIYAIAEKAADLIKEDI